MSVVYLWQLSENVPGAIEIDVPVFFCLLDFGLLLDDAGDDDVDELGEVCGIGFEYGGMDPRNGRERFYLRRVRMRSKCYSESLLRRLVTKI